MASRSPTAAGPTITSSSRKFMEYSHTSSSSAYRNGEQVYESSVQVSNSSNSHNAPVYHSSNLTELDTLLEDLNQARGSNGSLPRTTSPSRFRDNSESGTRVNALIQELEQNLKNPQNAASARWKGQEVKPITLTKFYSNSSERHQSTEREIRPIVVTTSPQHAISKPPAPAASNATRELDDLMTSLSDFKLKDKIPDQRPRSPTTPKTVPVVPLDSMLGELGNDMSKCGVDTVAKGCCYCCHKPIVGQVLTALGKTFHPEHFTCVHCGTELGTKNFFERDGEPYCETDYNNLFSPRCAYCSLSILDKCVSALGMTWHPEHFFCAHCGKAFNDDGFHEKDGKPYCRQDYFELFAPKCAGCAQPITDDYISALNAQWHTDCFVCHDCRCPFIGGSFFDHEGHPYCETHYHAKRGSLCAGCHKPITGRCITAMFRKFHPEHFCCSFCLKQLNKGTFKEQNDKPYCHPCFDKLFG